MSDVGDSGRRESAERSGGAEIDWENVFLRRGPEARSGLARIRSDVGLVVRESSLGHITLRCREDIG